jgi:hypothetical protein
MIGVCFTAACSGEPSVPNANATVVALTITGRRIESLRGIGVSGGPISTQDFLTMRTCETVSDGMNSATS